jgi:hypothetical protein
MGSDTQFFNPSEPPQVVIIAIVHRRRDRPIAVGADRLWRLDAGSDIIDPKKHGVSGDPQ